jgi:hypothetical protein
MIFIRIGITHNGLIIHFRISFNSLFRNYFLNKVLIKYQPVGPDHIFNSFYLIRFFEYETQVEKIVVDVRGANLRSKSFVLLQTLPPNVKDQLLPPLVLELAWILRIVILRVDIHHYCFAKGPLTDRTIDHKFMNAWHEVSSIYKQILVQVFIVKVFKVFRSCIFDVHVCKLIVETFVI